MVLVQKLFDKQISVCVHQQFSYLEYPRVISWDLSYSICTWTIFLMQSIGTGLYCLLMILNVSSILNHLMMSIAFKITCMIWPPGASYLTYLSIPLRVLMYHLIKQFLHHNIIASEVIPSTLLIAARILEL